MSPLGKFGPLERKAEDAFRTLARSSATTSAWIWAALSLMRIGKPRTQRRRQSRGLASRGGKFDDSHEDLEAGAPKVTTVTKIGNALAMASTGSSSKRTVEEEDGAAEGAAAGAGRLAGALAGAADGADEDVEGAVAADAR